MRTLFVVLVALCQIGVASAATLPKPVRDALKRANIPLSSIGVVVQQTDARTPLYSINARQGMNPASTIKLLTTFSALETLGPAYQWKTEAYLDGKLKDGVLHGNLLFKGYGNPKFTIEQFWLWLRELRQRGLQDIRGDLVLDHSFFEPTSHDAAEFDSDPTRAYNVGPNALLLNFNALHLRLIPEVVPGLSPGLNPDSAASGTSPTTALLQPDLSGYQITNRIITTARLPCHASNTYRARLEARHIVLEGTIPLNCGEVEDYFSLLSHNDYFFAVFSALWKELGGALQGQVREGSAPIAQPVFSTHLSPQLSEVIRDINKFSNNIMARQLFLTLGTAAPAPVPLVLDREISATKKISSDTDSLSEPDTDIAATPVPASSPLKVDNLLSNRLDAALPPLADAPQPGSPLEKLETLPAPISTSTSPDVSHSGTASIARSTLAVQHWLGKQQLRFPELVLENGAGLSRKERISAQHLADLLQLATHSRFAAELEASLPILGIDGSVKKRFKGKSIAGYAHLKTGTLEGVKSLAGYVQSHSGKQWIVVFIINHPHAAAGQDAQDALIEWLQTLH